MNHITLFVWEMCGCLTFLYTITPSVFKAFKRIRMCEIDWFYYDNSRNVEISGDIEIVFLCMKPEKRRIFINFFLFFFLFND